MIESLILVLQENIHFIIITVSSGVVGAYVTINRKTANLDARVNRNEKDFQNIAEHISENNERLTSLETSQSWIKEILGKMDKNIERIGEHNGSD
jgi:hypothetical protein